MSNDLEKVKAEFLEKLQLLTKEADVLNLKSDYVGKTGIVSEMLKSLKDMDAVERKSFGPKANLLKDFINEESNKFLSKLEVLEINEKLALDRIDISLSDNLQYKKIKNGGFHPRTIIQQEIEDIFLSMGFEVLDGPHIEDEFHNFEALNIPADHPARDMQDTFWFHDPHTTPADQKKYLLRTHTSNIQVRGMLSRKPPFRFIAPGVVFRSERTDASHEMVFTQLEGMMIGKDISVANLIYFMKTILKEIFKKM